MRYINLLTYLLNKVQIATIVAFWFNWPTFLEVIHVMPLINTEPLLTAAADFYKSNEENSKHKSEITRKK